MDPLENIRLRVFVTDGIGETRVFTEHEYVTHMGVSPAAHAAFDLIHDDGVDALPAWRLALAMDSFPSPRGDAEAQARHYVKLRRAMRYSP